jgi:uroporphyrin-III C-methyltransferase
VITDRLGPRDLLDSLAAHVEVIDAAKIPYGRAMNQARINELLVEHVRAGKFVVRLKGGDPFVFGRGFEEVLACAEAGVPVTVVPGVTSAFAAPAVADVPVSHRGVAHEIVVVSGHVPPGDPRSLVDWPALARLRGTLVLLMAVERVGLFAEALIEGGRPADTPVAVVQDGTMRIQRSVRATLATVAAAVQEQGIRPPAVVVIGQVAGLVPGRVTDHLDQEEPNVAEAKGSLLDLTVRDLLDVLAAGTPAPGGGGAAALVTAMAAALAGMASRFGDGSAATRSDDLRHRAAALADADAVAYEAFLTAVRLPHEDPGRPAAVADARRDAIGVPAEIGELAAEVAELAAGLARDGNPRLRGDAVAAVRIAAAAAGTAAELVAANVHGEEGVAELERVRVFATAARDHATELNPD